VEDRESQAGGAGEEGKEGKEDEILSGRVLLGFM